MRKANYNYGTRYLYDGDRLVREKTYFDEIWYLYDQNGMTGFQLNGSSYLYVRNLQGDVVKVISRETGTVYASYTYDAWGKCTIGTNLNNIATRNPIRYRGYYYDSETGFYYLNSRYYDPETGRFISPDSISIAISVGDFNLYTYCTNDPINYSDPTGYSPKLAFTYATAASVLSALLEMGIGFGLAMAGHAIKTGVRPPNIGLGIFAKTQAKQLNNLTKASGVASKIATSLAIISTAIQVGEGVLLDISRNYSTDRIITNTITNTVLYGGTTLLAGLTGAKLGGLAGSVVPGLGNVVGAAVGFGIGIGASLMLEIEVNNKTIGDHIRDGIYTAKNHLANLWERVFG